LRAKPRSPISASRVAADAQGKYQGSRGPGPKGSKFAFIAPRMVLIVSIVLLPDGLPALTLPGLSEHVVPGSSAGTAQPKLTSTGIGIFDGFVTTLNMTVAGTPRVICTVPGVTIVRLIFMLVVALAVKVATAGAALLPAFVCRAPAGSELK